MSSAAQASGRFGTDDSLGLTGIGAVVLAGGLLSWTTAYFPAQMPGWGPYEFSWVSYLGVALTTLWYVTGLARAPRAEWPSIPRIVAFGLGMALIYTALLSHFVYLAQHMFFLNRVQHSAMHHVAPFLLALSWPGAMIRRGMPAWAARGFRARWIHWLLDWARQPVIAGVLFAGLVALWLQPDVHFRAMLSPPLYEVMNWTMVGDGLLFWFLVLDPRPRDEAGVSYATRLALVILVEFPQIVIGANLTFTQNVLYEFYDLCGRLFPSIPALLDQHIGGLVVWIPQGMMGAIAFLLIMNNMRRHEDRSETEIIVGGRRVSSSDWTGR